MRRSSSSSKRKKYQKGITKIKLKKLRPLETTSLNSIATLRSLKLLSFKHSRLGSSKDTAFLFLTSKILCSTSKKRILIRKKFTHKLLKTKTSIKTLSHTFRQRRKFLICKEQEETREEFDKILMDINFKISNKI